MTDRPDDALGWRGPLVALVCGSVVALGILEGAARRRPLHRIQEVDLTHVPSTVRDGVPTWMDAESDPVRMGAPCDGRPEVLLVGSSIFYGSGVDSADSLRPKLDANLSTLCVRSVAQPAFTFDNQRAVVDARLADSPPDFVVWEVWHNSPNRWSIIGNAAYNFGPASRTAEQLPSPFSLPPALHAALFRYTATYRHLVAARVQDNKEHWSTVWERFVDDRITPAVHELHQRGIPVMFVFVPPLDRPFAESAADTEGPYAVVRERLAGQVELVDVAAGMAARGADVEASRVDTCCHYSPTGNSLVADVLTAPIEAMVDAGQP